MISEKFPHLDGSGLFFRDNFTLGDALFWEYEVISCASVRDRIHSSSSNILVVGSLSFFKNMSCVCSKKRHSCEMSPVAHLTVRMSRNLKSLFPDLHLRKQ